MMNLNLRLLSRPLLALFVSLTLLPAQDQAVVAIEEAPERVVAPFLWRIEGAVPSYLFGTIHVPDPRVTELHPAAAAAFEEADAVYTELELEMKTMLDVQKRTMLTGGRTLQDMLPEADFARLRKWLGKYGIPIQALNSVKPWAVMSQLPMIPKIREYATGTALDVKLYDEAKAAGKTVGGLEKVEEQIGVFESFSEAEQVTMLTEALDDVIEAEAKGEDSLEDLLQVYLRGDAVRMFELMHEQEMNDPKLQERLMEQLLWSRNERMVERLLKLRAEQPDKVFFFAVGAAHYPAERGILQLLRDQGIEVTRLAPPAAQDAGSRLRLLEAENEALRSELEDLREQLRKLRRKAG